jgi:hypothetical protein
MWWVKKHQQIKRLVSNKKTFNIYLFFLLISLIGNAAADFAIVWLGSSLSQGNTGIEIISGFYIGQCLGYVFLAPYMSSALNSLSKRVFSIVIDLSYIATYLIVLLLYINGSLDFVKMLFISVIMAALSSVHRNGVTFSLLNQLSSEIDIKKIVKNYTYVFNLTLLSGAALSGVIFNSFGFEGCVILAIMTFLPMLAIYIKVFNNESKTNEDKKVSGKGLFHGFNVLNKNKNLLHSAIGTSFGFLVGAVFPALIAIYGRQKGMTEAYSSMVISIGILLGTITIPFISKYGVKFKYNNILAIAFIPTTLALFPSLWSESPIYFNLAFAMNCIGFSVLNVTTIMIRIKDVDDSEIQVLNTAYYAVMSIGQMVGTLILVPLIKTSYEEALLVMLISYLVAVAIFKFKLSRKTVEELIN